jgi:predicted RNA methylase
MEVRHQCLLPPDIIKNKSILDLGCCVGATGAWAMANGAASYCGVEYHKDLADIAKSNFEKSFPNSSVVIVNDSVENFFKTLDVKFDILIASGVMYAFYDPIPVLDLMIKSADTIIVESAHPYNNRTLNDGTLTNTMFKSLKQTDDWEYYIENESFISFRRQNMLWGAKEEEVYFNSSIPSMGFLKSHMTINGFSCDTTINDNLKNTLPQNYNAFRRFAVKFTKIARPVESQGFVTAVGENTSDKTIVSWKET